ncbi:unnamed protein product [Adineta ricciae]|uniref:Uncharacterized protein n=1 Tax=Adineta ricciae TaxID=249248 RepID=A0A815A1A4_ADIRI|nr:unnamed protein product [Adineta ricciae]
MRLSILFALAVCIFSSSEKATAINFYDTKLAANDFLLVFHTLYTGITNDSVRYQCHAFGNETFEVDFPFKSIQSFSIGREQNQTQLYFVISGAVNESMFYMSKITAQCHKNRNTKVSLPQTVFFKTQNMSRAIVSVDPQGHFAIGVTDTSVFYYNLVTLEHFTLNVTWPDSKTFLPLAVDISHDFIYIAGNTGMKLFPEDDDGAMRSGVANIYVLSITNRHTIQFYDRWESNVYFINSAMKLSLRVNLKNEQVLFGMPTINTVHLLLTNKTSNHLVYLTSKTTTKGVRVGGYGWIVEWCDNYEKAIIVNVEYYGNSIKSGGSYFEYYDMNNNHYINNSTMPFSIFPNSDQENSGFSSSPVALLAATASALYVMNVKEDILVIPPSKPGYFSVNHAAMAHPANPYSIYTLIPNIALCPPGTYKNDTGPWSCRQCQMNSSQQNVSHKCSQCNDESYCPLEHAIYPTELYDTEQYTGYPETPEIDVFADILLRNMFRINCLRTSPFLYTMIALIIAITIAIIIGSLKFSKRTVVQQTNITRALQYLDLIEQGSLWFGGLVSIVLMVLLGLAVLFSYSFYYQYPITNEHEFDDNACLSNHHLNAKFETNLQFLKQNPRELGEIFHLLDSQDFTLNIEVISKAFHCGRLLIQSAYPVSCYTRGFISYASTKLFSHQTPTIIQLRGRLPIDAIRIGLTAPEIRQMNNHVQTLNVSKVFNDTSRIVGSTRAFPLDLHLTKIINITEGLTNADQTMYSGLWFLTFSSEPTRLYVADDPDSVSSRDAIELKLAETSFFIKNRQKPIARNSEIIFSTILFVCMCLDLLCMIFLLIKLWLKPILKLLILKLCPSNSWLHLLINENRADTSADIDELKNNMANLTSEMNILKEKISSLS